MSYSLGIDASTQSISAIVLDLDNSKIVCDYSINFGQYLPEYKSPNGFISTSIKNEFKKCI